MPYRFDRAELRRPRRTPEGYLHVDGVAATPGVYVYADGNGKTRRELVTAEMLSQRADLDSLVGKPYTRRHHGLLDSTTVAPHAAGAVLDAHYDDGVVASIVVHRADAIAAIEAGDHELSLGYDTTGIDETPGEHPEFGAYDCIQLGRKYNHLAGVPRGRSGREAAMRLDADDLFQEAPVFKLPASLVALLTAGALIREDGAAPEAPVDDTTAIRIDAEWTAAVINDLPDSAFLYVEEGDKDADGKTTPRSKRHFPVKGPDGAVDLPHARNALARIPQSDVPQAAKDAATSKAQVLLAAVKERQDSAADALAALLGALGVASIEEARAKMDAEWQMMCAARDALNGLQTLVGAEDAAGAKAAIEQMRADMTKRMDAAPSDDALLAYAAERMPLIERAVALGVAHDKATNPALRKAIACAIEPTARQDGSDDYYAGICAASHVDAWSALRPRPGRDPRREDGVPPPAVVPDPYATAFERRRAGG